MSAPACLRTVADLVDTIQAKRVVRRLTRAGVLGRGSSEIGVIIAGYGVRGGGASWAEAAVAWSDAARAKADQIERDRDLVERMTI